MILIDNKASNSFQVIVFCRWTRSGKDCSTNVVLSYQTIIDIQTYSLLIWLHVWNKLISVLVLTKLIGDIRAVPAVVKLLFQTSKWAIPLNAIVLTQIIHFNYFWNKRYFYCRLSSNICHCLFSVKIVIKGDRNTGKTCMFHRLQGRPFTEQYIPTNEIQAGSIHWSYKGKQ